MPKSRALIIRRTNEEILRRKYPRGGVATLADLGKKANKWKVVGSKVIKAPFGFGIIHVPNYKLMRIKPGTGSGAGGGRRGRHRGHLKKSKN